MSAPRAHCREIIVGKLPGDNAVAAIAGASILVCNRGTSVPIAQTIYADATSATTLSNPLSSGATGIVEFWVPIEQTIDLLVSVPGFATQIVTCEALVALESGAVNLNTTQALANPGDTRINGENFTWQGASGAHTASSLDQAQTFTAVKTFQAGISADSTHVLTLPALTDTLALLAAAQTLTNKTLTTPVITGSGGTLTLPAGPDTLVGRATTDTLTNKTLTAPIMASFMPDGTHTLTAPAATDTLVGRATTDTLTNKTLTTPVITGSGGTLTLPAGPDTLVGRATTDTLANKTLTTPVLGGTSTVAATLGLSGASQPTYGNGSLAIPMGPNTLHFSTAAAGIGAGATRYLMQGVDIGGITTSAGTPVAYPVTLAKLYVATFVAPGAGQSWTFTLYKNGVAQTMTCAVSGASAVSANDTAHSVPLVAGDVVCVQVVATAGAAAGGFFTATVAP